MLSAVWLAACSDPVPTSVVVQIRNRVFDVADQLAITVYDDSGLATHTRLQPRDQTGFAFPNDVVLYPPRPGQLRLLVRAHKAIRVAEGAATVYAEKGEQVTTAVLMDGVLVDGDGDGVPDVIDNCVSLPNPRQSPCHDDLGADGLPDGGVRDSSRDLPGDGHSSDGSVGSDGNISDAPLDGPIPHDAQPADTLRPDTLRPDTLRPDTLRPDVRPPCSCPLGCRPDNSCRQPVPSNVAMPSSFAPTVAIRSNESVTFDTTLCNQTGARISQGLCILAVESLLVHANGLLRIVGDRPLVVLSQGDVLVGANAQIDLSAIGSVPGPGGSAGGVPTNDEGPGVDGEGPGGGHTCDCSSGSADDCGGGGGSHGSLGAPGGSDGAGCFSKKPTPGPVYGNDLLVPLVGGSGGGSGGQAEGDPLTASHGGGGGGALQISSWGTITIGGAINAGGGGGQRGSQSYFASGAGGGGSGGAILLEAATIQGSGIIAANGGGGGSGTRVACAGTDGEDGKASTTPAKGGASCSRGGDGAAGATAATAGENGGGSIGGAGGGGGLGRVRLNWAPGSPAPDTLEISASKTTGHLTVQ